MLDMNTHFIHKHRWSLDGHTTPLEGSAYANVMPRKRLKILFKYDLFNSTDAIATDIKNTCLQSPSSEKHYVAKCPIFGPENDGKRVIICRVAREEISNSADFRNHLCSRVSYLDFNQ